MKLLIKVLLIATTFSVGLPVIGQMKPDRNIRPDEVSSDKAKVNLPADSVYLFTDKQGRLVLQNAWRQVGPLSLEITNFAGKPVLLKLSIDRSVWVDMTIKSPEKKVLLCPDGTGRMYLIIDPDNPHAVKTIIHNNEKYELFFNKSTSLFDIMKL